MYTSKKQNINLRLNFLICSLFVLTSTDKLFTVLDLRKDIYCIIDEQSLIMEHFEALCLLLNKIPLRQFAYILIRPILFKKLISSKALTPIEHKELDTQAILLRKYLKKFREFYRRYFRGNEKNKIVLLTDKEINFFAIETLFLIAGV